MSQACCPVCHLTVWKGRTCDPTFNAAILPGCAAFFYAGVCQVFFVGRAPCGPLLYGGEIQAVVLAASIAASAASKVSMIEAWRFL